MIKKVSIIFTILFLFWVIASFIDINAHNLNNGHFQAWNMFVMLKNMIE